jgi:type IV pilus assembly protein PilA
MKKQKGFTLIELLIVIGIIAILASIIYVAVDPARRLGEARDAQRWSSANSILNAVLKFTVDNSGVLPSPLATTTADLYYVLGTNTSGCDSTCAGQTPQAACLNLGHQLVDAYLSAIPVDGLTGSDAKTRYYIKKSANGRITVGACDPERAASISVSR